MSRCRGISRTIPAGFVGEMAKGGFDGSLPKISAVALELCLPVGRQQSTGLSPADVCLDSSPHPPRPSCAT